MSTWAKRIFIFTVAVTLLGCNSYHAKDQGGAGIAAHEASNPDFATVSRLIIKPYCLTCHSSGASAGGVNLETYSSVKRFIGMVHDSVVLKQNMPPGQPLSHDLQQIMINWVSNGAPETVQVGDGGAGQPSPSPSAQPDASASPSPSASPEPVQATFTSISKNIFVPKCAVCHDSSGATPVTDYKFLTRSSWVVPGKAAESSLFKAIKGGSMPPGEPLTDDEIKAVEKWINDGAPEN